MRSGLARQALAEFIGTSFLLMAVVGSGIAASRLSPGDAGLQLLPVAVVTGAAGGYIAAAYFFTSSTSFANPAVTVARTLSDTLAGTAPPTPRSSRPSCWQRLRPWLPSGCCTRRWKRSPRRSSCPTPSRR